jgi:phenylacetate-CoA ligase
MYPHQIYHLVKMVRTKYLKPESLRVLQEKKLRRLLIHLWLNVPYYRNWFENEGITPNDIRNLEDFRRFPFSDKEQIQALPLEAKSAGNIDLNRCKSFLTSGTTGLPLQFSMTYLDFTLRNLNSARAYLACGMKAVDKMAVLAGDMRVNERKSWNEYVKLWRRKEISSWEDPKTWVIKLKAWDPQIMIGRVTTLKLLADAVRKRGGRDISPRLVFSSAGILDDLSRQYLADSFLAGVIDFYFTFEGGCLAWECQRCSGYHMSSDTLLIEVLKDGKPAQPGQEGEVVITNLHSYAMPFIRYRQGDSVLLSDQPPQCGCNFPLIKKIYGRKDDYIVLRSGRKVPPQPVYHVMIPVKGVRRWKIMQESLDKIVIFIEAERDFNSGSEAILRREMFKLLREEINLDIKRVRSIPIDSSKKFKPVSSKVKAI